MLQWMGKVSVLCLKKKKKNKHMPPEKKQMPIQSAVFGHSTLANKNASGKVLSHCDRIQTHDSH